MYIIFIAKIKNKSKNKIPASEYNPLKVQKKY